MAGVFNFVVENEDLAVRFSCPNHEKRIGEIIKNLMINRDNAENVSKMESRFAILEGTGVFVFNGVKEENPDIRHEAVFFENTEYPLIVRGRNGKTLTEISFEVNDRRKNDEEDPKSTIISEGGELYGALNFRNQVGMTDFTIRYKLKGDGQTRILKFATEVLSYKLDYRTDLRTIISDIEREYALLSASFLKDTYLSMRAHSGESHDLIWWQIFKSCYQEIVRAAKTIIERPKRRLRSVPRYERAERLRTLPRELENEYQTHMDNPAHLYRTEEMMLSHDTIENRFLKHAINELTRKFISIKQHIMTALHLEDLMKLDTSIDEMEKELLRLKNDPFFRGVGTFKGFSQDNLVMKQAHGYKTIMEKWIELQQGYELAEGMRKLEVKDISDLYEIWCFIKVKNIVDDTLRGMGKDARQTVNGKAINREFIPNLVYGGSMSFIDRDDVELACVSYNPEVKTGEKSKASAILGTDSMTTIQRPDIVLRLTKTFDSGMKYTYLFDAKYRIDDKKINGMDMPPEDAINQMHRYRDAIYYTEEGKDREHLKKEIIAGYVLFPGRISPKALDMENADDSTEEKYHYQASNQSIGIGAFPLRPDQSMETDEDGSIIVNPDSSEKALRDQIRRWLEEENGLERLRETAIAQRGLEYHKDGKPTESDLVLVGYYRSGQWEAIEKNRLYYVPAALGKGSINLVSGFEKTKYLLLHHDKRRILVRLKGEGPKFYPKPALEELGFAPTSGEYFLGFEIKSLKPVEGIDVSGYRLENKNPKDKTSYFTTMERLMKAAETEQKARTPKQTETSWS